MGWGRVGFARRGCKRVDDGFSMVVVVLALLVTAGLTALVIGATVHSGSGSDPSSGASSAPGVGLASDQQAQQSLSQALTSASGAAATPGGAGTLDASTLAASDPSLTFVDGASSSPNTVSVASTDAGVTLSDRSSDGVCWLVWRAGSSSTWYGAQTGLASCTAPALSGPPSAGPVSASAIGWQQNTFPAP